MNEPYLIAQKGERVVLRDKKLSDAADDYKWRLDKELTRLDAAPPLKLSYREYMLFYREEIDYPSPGRRRFGIDTVDGKHIGNCMYYDIDIRSGQAEMGIMLGDRDYWSKGYGSDAVRTLLDYIFNRTSLSRVYLHTLGWNIRAHKSFQKAGFVPVKYVRRDGYNFLHMEILKEWWQKPKSKENGKSQQASEPTQPSPKARS